MHPDPAFRIDEAACRSLARRIAFAHIFVDAATGRAVIHAPCVPDDDGHLTFHVSRRNRALPLPDGAHAIASFAAADGYVSPDWYASSGQVPTWNYVAAEAEGRIVALSSADLVTQLDALSGEHEARLSSKPAWTRAKMPPGRFSAMLNGIAGYRLRVEAWRGTAKLSQNKPVGDVAGVIAGLRGTGRDDPASLVEERRVGGRASPPFSA